MKKLIAIGVLLASAAMLVGCGKKSERSSGTSGKSDESSGKSKSHEASDGETKIFTLPGGVRMEMVYVAPGSFRMGSENGKDDEKPVHKVTLTKGYWIGKYPVTQAQWNALISAMEVRFEDGRPVAWFSKNGWGRDVVSGMDTSDFPMERISWVDCVTLVAALNKADREGLRWSLPTEAQWEFAARGGNKSRGYTYSGGNDLDAVGWYYENSGTRRLSDSDWKMEDLTSNKCRPHSVNEKDIGNELGIVGMSGNVWEWCNDWYDKDYYSNSPTEDPQGPASGEDRVLRGGGWNDYARNCRSAFRNGFFPVDRISNFGFRLCCSAGPREAGAEQGDSRAAEQSGRGGAGRCYAASAGVAAKEESETEASVSRDTLPKGPKHGQNAVLALPGGATMEMIYVAPGSFTMGSPTSEDGHDDEEKQHPVTLTKGYWLGKYEVTQAQWESVMGENPSNFKGDKRPVENVSWQDCQRFIRKINSQQNCGARLPTEAEWEYACRAGSTGPYGGNGNLDDMGWYYGNSGGETHPVGQKHANAWGFYDMYGNVREWCEDWRDVYGSATTDPTGPASGGNRVLRGGGGRDGARFCRSASRGWYDPDGRDGHNGFRLCCSAGPREAGAEREDSRAAESGGRGGAGRRYAASAGVTVQEESGIEASASRDRLPKDAKHGQEAGADREDSRVTAVHDKRDKKESLRPKADPEDGECKAFMLPGGVRMEMVYVAPGSFQMGSENGEDDEKPVHKVTLTKGYWIGKYPVTQAQWNALVSAMDVSFDRGRPVAWFSKNGRGSDIVSGMDTSDFPMENISWDDCKGLVDALNKADCKGLRWSLPTEAQWEFAARGGNKSRGYTYSGGNDLDAVGWYYENLGTRRLSENDWDPDKLKGNKNRPHSVKEKDIGNELGIVGMSGNVWEWCNDRYDSDYYSSSPTEDPQGPASGGNRVLRGGCWGDFARRCRSAIRDWSLPGDRDDYIGFRLCCSAGPREAGAEREDSRAAEPGGRGGAGSRYAASAGFAAKEESGIEASVSRDILPKDAKHGQEAVLALPGGATMEMIYVAPGTFTMGSLTSEKERRDGETPHQVTLTKGFWLGKYEVTQTQWESVMGENPSRFKGGNCPVENVSWEDCQRFISEINSQQNCGARLPTEAEWEYACRAGSTGPYGGNGNLDDMGWYDSNSGRETHPVGQKQANAWGFYDMHGNVYEWCNDWYGSYDDAVTDPTGSASGESRVLRGGSWHNLARYCHSASRVGFFPDYRFDDGRFFGDLGFRLCCSAGPRE